MQLASISNDNPWGSPGDGCLSLSSLILDMGDSISFSADCNRFHDVNNANVNGLKLLGARITQFLSIEGCFIIYV